MCVEDENLLPFQHLEGDDDPTENEASNAHKLKGVNSIERLNFHGIAISGEGNGWGGGA